MMTCPAEGAPSISYYDAANGALKLATCNISCGTASPEWVISVIDDAGDAGRWSALVLNGHVPGIAYSAVIRSCNGSVCHEVDELRFAVCSPVPGHATSDMPCGIGTVDSDMAGLHPAMLRGGVCILDEGNRMNEKSWASLAPLFDHRRYVESIVAGIGECETWNPAANVPPIGTEFCGCARGGMVSDIDSHGSTLGCCLKSVNQLHAVAASREAIASARG